MNPVEADSPAVPGAAAPDLAAKAAFVHTLETQRQWFDRELAAWLAVRREGFAVECPEAQRLADQVTRLVTAGGKRLRPSLVWTTYEACGGHQPALLPLALATELLHTYLLIHDDIMDHAEVRRGLPAVHTDLAAFHRQRGWSGDAADWGVSTAILVGDLAAAWAQELAFTGAFAGSSPVAVLHTWSAMSAEVIAGQHLEMVLPLAARQGDLPAEVDLLRVLRLKSGRYSVERPIELGARAAGASDAQLLALSAFGRSAGEAFQLQDDLLGVFGDPAATGKPVGADLAEGKHTFLVHFTLEHASPAERQWLLASLGAGPAFTAADAARARSLMAETGARARVELMIDARLATAREALEAADLPARARAFFTGLLVYLRERES